MAIGCDFGESSFYHESAHRSRKQRKCIETFRVIEPETETFTIKTGVK